MSATIRYLLGGCAVVLAVAGLAAGLWAGGVLRADSGNPASALEGVPAVGLEGEAVVLPEQAGGGGSSDPLIFSWAAKFVCTESLQPGTYFYGPGAPPVVQQKTDVLIHNPNEYPVSFWNKAVQARLQDSPPISPSAWKQGTIAPDHAIRINCDDIAKLLTGNPSATFIGTYGIGVTVEGFVVIASGPQTVVGSPVQKTGLLDVTSEYVRGSEVLKKDISYQPWWWWWWWNLPWRVGYQYNRIANLGVSPIGNHDCRASVYSGLMDDVQGLIADPLQRQKTFEALQAGMGMDPTQTSTFSQSAPPALVVLIGSCEKSYNDNTQTTVADINYIIVSNKGPSDPNPITGGIYIDPGAAYPWIPGRFHDLNVVIPNNSNTDADLLMRTWLSQKWVSAGGGAGQVNAAMYYFFPWWCGNAYWGWWNGGDCIDIGVGEGESLDVEQVTPQRVLFYVWPPS